MTVITSKYRSDVTKLFVDDVKIGNYYLFVSSTANTSVLNSELSKNEFLEKTIFGKRIDPEEAYYAIRNYPWQSGLVYEQYDDSVDLEGKKYYAVVYPEVNGTGTYKIYKCLFNNYGANSISPPNYNSITPDQIYIMPDGYVWKYLYDLTENEFDKYNANGYIPIIHTSNTEIIAGSEIDQIFVTNKDTNRGYDSTAGNIVRVLTGEENVIEIVANNFEIELNPVENYYSGYSFYVTNSVGESEIYNIDTYSYNLSTGKALITLLGGIPTGLPHDEILLNTSTFTILPRIKILGDGTGAVAVPNISANGNISSIRMLNKGSGYTNVIAYIPDPISFSPGTIASADEAAILRPVLSPTGGHGTNLVSELSCKHALIYNNLTEFDNSIIPITNSFASVGIVKDPEFKTGNTTPDVFDNRIKFELESHSLTVNEIITQIETNIESNFYNDISFSGKVHSISNNSIYVCEYMGAYQNGVNESNTSIDFSDISLNTELPLFSSQDDIIIINNGTILLNADENASTVSISPYIQRSGEVYYMNRFLPIQRTEDSREQFKIIIEF